MSQETQALVHPAVQLSAAAQPTEAAVTKRLVAIDLLRGVAMLLMALDHWAPFTRVDLTVEGYNGIRPELGTWGQIVTGLITNLSSGIFFTLTGTSVAFFERSRRKRGWTEWEITRFLLIRALILLVLDQVVNRIGWAVTELPLFEVLSALAFTLAVLSVCRRLPLRIIAVLAAVLFLIYPLLVTLFPHDPARPLSTVTTILLQNNRDSFPMVANPLLARLSVVLFGYVVGRLLVEDRLKISPSWLWVALGGFVAWFLLRMGLLQGYGDFLPYQPGAPFVDLFIDSKQPPSFTFLIFNMSVAIVMLVSLHMLPKRFIDTPIVWVLKVLGQTSLFFFVAHMLFYRLLWRIFQGEPIIPPALVGNSEILRLLIECALTLVVLVPICAVYRKLRQKYSILSYL
ncbi:MAG: hypothetical protein BroJett033_6300 [Chloroflexota bacterium]|nr:MAG: hypothetical protein BroJett033_6300 [Chloroflexota bacterium]